MYYTLFLFLRKSEEWTMTIRTYMSFRSMQIAKGNSAHKASKISRHYVNG